MMTISTTKAAAAGLITSGLLLGIAIGVWFDDLTIGLSLGLLLGAVGSAYA